MKRRVYETLQRERERRASREAVRMPVNRMRESHGGKMADLRDSRKCWKCSSSETEQFQRKPHKDFDLRCPLSMWQRFQDEQTLQK